jgi:nucleoid-associated protein YgaU
MGSIEKVMVAGILVIICVILGIAIWGAESLDDGSIEPAQAAHKPVAIEKGPSDANHAATPPATAAKPDLKVDEKSTTPKEEKTAQVSPPATETPAAPPAVADSDPLAPASKAGSEALKSATTAKAETAPAGKKDTAQATDATPDKNAVWQYTVKKGDTYSAIAQRFYGSAGAATRIARLNEDADEQRLRPGQVLSMPPVGAAGQGKTTASWYPQKEPKLSVPAKSPDAQQPQDKQSGQRTYIVREGDTLIRIAREVLGTEKWQKLYDLNRDKLTNGTNLKPGQELILPSEN